MTDDRDSTDGRPGTDRPASTDAWNPSLYDDDHAFVHEYGADLLDLLAPGAGDRVLDLGCGTGHLTAEIGAAGASVVGVDRSGEMVRRARQTYPDLAVVRADARALPFDGRFDAVFSNAALHWVREQDAALDAVADVLVPGGRFVAELGGAGNVASIERALTDALEARGHETVSPWFFPSVAEYATLLDAHGFEPRYVRLFDRPTELDGGADGLRNWLTMFGGALLDDLSDAERTAVVERVEDRLRDDQFRDGRWVADYRRLRFVAFRV